jgi:hypothetical protein
MTTPPATGRTFAGYALGFALTITALLLDIRHGGELFLLIALSGSLIITTLLLYRVARAMAFSPTAARPRTLPVCVPPGYRDMAA